MCQLYSVLVVVVVVVTASFHDGDHATFVA